MAAMNTVLEGNSGTVDMAAIAERIGAPEEDVRQALQSPETVQAIMRDRHLSEDFAILLLIANAQARQRKDAIVTLPA